MLSIAMENFVALTAHYVWLEFNKTNNCMFISSGECTDIALQFHILSLTTFFQSAYEFSRVQCEMVSYIYSQFAVTGTSFERDSRYY